MAIGTIADLIRTQVMGRPNRAAVTFGEVTLTFNELDERANRAAQALAAEGVTQQDRVAYLGKNSPEFFELLVGAAKLNAVTAAVNWRLAPAEVVSILNDAQARVLVVGREFAPSIEAGGHELASVDNVVVVDAWFRTGDAGYLDADGYLYINDRVKDMIISGGENIYPGEVENALMSNPAVADVAVIGIPCDRWGKRRRPLSCSPAVLTRPRKRSKPTVGGSWRAGAQHGELHDGQRLCHQRARFPSASLSVRRPYGGVLRTRASVRLCRAHPPGRELPRPGPPVSDDVPGDHAGPQRLYRLPAAVTGGAGGRDRACSRGKAWAQAPSLKEVSR